MQYRRYYSLVQYAVKAQCSTALQSCVVLQNFFYNSPAPLLTCKRGYLPTSKPPPDIGMRLNRSSRRSFTKVSSDHQRSGLIFFRLAQHSIFNSTKLIITITAVANSTLSTLHYYLVCFLPFHLLHLFYLSKYLIIRRLCTVQQGSR